MTPENDWNTIRNQPAPWFGAAGMSILRITLLFGSAAVALALVLTPMAHRYAESNFVGVDGLDYTATGSIGNRNAYTVRRSVLQETGAVCIIRASGERIGDC